MREILFGACLAMVMSIAVFTVTAWPVPEQPVAALFPADPGSRKALRAVAEAQGSIIDVVGNPRWVISIASRENYARSLYRAGAWLVIDARLALLCFGDRNRTMT